MSSPIRNRPETRPRSGKSAGASRRDKHDKLRIARERFRQDMLSSKRENITGLQDQQAYEKQFEDQHREYDVDDLNKLLDEEIELQYELNSKNTAPRDATNKMRDSNYYTETRGQYPIIEKQHKQQLDEDRYQQQLEEFLRLEQLEMEELLTQLDIG